MKTIDDFVVAGQRVLVESRSWFDDERVTALRLAGKDLR